jgi:hypothetical protein
MTLWALKKHDGGLRGSYGHIGNGNAVGLDQNGS